MDASVPDRRTPMVLCMTENLNPGATKTDAIAVEGKKCKAIGENIKGFRRTTSGWSEDGKKVFVFEVFDTAEAMLQGMQYVDMPELQRCLSFDTFWCQCAQDQFVGEWGDMVKNFGMNAFSIDGVGGLDTDLTPLLDPPSGPMVCVAIQSPNPGITQKEMMAVHKKNSDAAATCAGYKRQMGSWNAEGTKCLIVEIFDKPETYFEWVGKVEMPEVMRCIKMEKVMLQCSSAQLKAFGDMPKNFGMEIFLTDGTTGHNSM